MKRLIIYSLKFIALTASGLAVPSIILVSVSYMDDFINTNSDRILIFIGAADFLLLFALKKPITRWLKTSESLYFTATSVTPLLLSIIMLLVFVYSAADREKLNKVMSDQKSMEALLGSPQVKALLKTFLKGGGKNG